MKNTLFIKDSIVNKISFYHLALFLILLPFDRFYSELTLISFLVHTVINFKKEQLKKLNKDTLWLSALFVLTAVTTFYSADKSQGSSLIERRLGIILFPLLLGINPLPLSKYKLTLLKIFSITCAATIVYLFIYNLIVIYYNNRNLSDLFSSYFLNHNFSAPIEMHATYLSMYVLLSLACCMYLLVKEGKKTRLLYIILIFILLTGIIQLSSRAAMIATFVIVVVAFPLMVLPKMKHRLILWGIAVLSLGLFYISLSIFEDLKTRNIKALVEDLSTAPPTQDRLEPRVIRWECAWELFTSSPIIGYGNGSEIKKLKEKYFEKKYYLSFLNELNAHNQYLGLLISYGIIGLLLYLYILFRGARSAIANWDFIFASFLIIIIIVSISENILDVNKGIFFYAFFITFFLYANKSNGASSDKSPIPQIDHESQV